MPPVGRYYAALVTRRWKPVAAIVAACTLVAWLGTVLLLTQFPKFEAAARLNIVPTGEELGYANRFVRGTTFDGGGVLLQTYAELAHTRPVVTPVVDRYIRERAAAERVSVPQWVAANSTPSVFAPGPWISLLQYGPTPPRPLRDQLVDKLVDRTTIETIEGTYLLRLTVAWSDPDSSAWLANALAEGVVAAADASSREAGSQISSVLGARLAQTRASLAASLAKSRALKNRLGIVDIDRQKQSLLEERLAQQALVTTDRADYQASQARLVELRKRVRGKLSAAQQQAQQLLAAEAPRVDGLARSIPVRQARVEAIGAQLAVLGRNEEKVKTLDDEVALLQGQVKSLEDRVSFSQTENLANAPRIRLIERALPPPVRSQPKTLFNTVLGFLAGCALAGCWLLLFDMPAAPLRRDDDDAGDDGRQDRLPFAEPAPLVVATPRALRQPAEPLAAADDRFLVRRLPRPAKGHAYGAAEVASLGPRVATWLADTLARPGRALFIVAAGADADARCVYQLVHEHLRKTGETLRTIDGTLRSVPADDAAAPARPLIYGAGLAENAKPVLLSDPEADVLLVIESAGKAGRAALAAFRANYPQLAGATPYVVALGR